MLNAFFSTAVKINHKPIFKLYIMFDCFHECSTCTWWFILSLPFVIRFLFICLQHINLHFYFFLQYKATPRVQLNSKVHLKSRLKRKADSELPHRAKRPLLEENANINYSGARLTRRSSRLSNGVCCWSSSSKATHSIRFAEIVTV